MGQGVDAFSTQQTLGKTATGTGCQNVSSRLLIVSGYLWTTGDFAIRQRRL